MIRSVASLQDLLRQLRHGYIFSYRAVSDLGHRRYVYYRARNRVALDKGYSPFSGRGGGKLSVEQRPAPIAIDLPAISLDHFPFAALYDRTSRLAQE